jgi:MarR family transcriptional regulator, transcriptional regulator for hemolysin
MSDVAEIADGGTEAVVLLTRLARSAYRNVDSDLLGMTLKEFTALSAVRDTDGRGQKELGEALMLDANALTLLMNSLEDRGWVRRARDPHDRRRQFVSVTKVGRSALAAAEEAMGEAASGVLDRLSDRQRLELRDLLARALGDEITSRVIRRSAGEIQSERNT